MGRVASLCGASPLSEGINLHQRGAASHRTQTQRQAMTPATEGGWGGLGVTGGCPNSEHIIWLTVEGLSSDSHFINFIYCPVLLGKNNGVSFPVDFQQRAKTSIPHTHTHTLHYVPNYCMTHWNKLCWLFSNQSLHGNHIQNVHPALSLLCAQFRSLEKNNVSVPIIFQARPKFKITLCVHCVLS